MTGELPDFQADDLEPDARTDRGAWPVWELAFTIVLRDDRPDQCTVYPADARSEDLVTEWITADEGGFVDVRAMR